MSERRLRTKAGTNLLHALVAMTGTRDQAAYFEQVAAIEAEAAGGVPEALDLLNSLGIAGPNIRHALQVGPDPKWPAEEREVYEALRADPTTADDEWCVCGRLWPCEALRLGELLGSL